MKNDFLETLFEKEEMVVVSQDRYGIKGAKAKYITKDYQFFSINPIKYGTTRADKNVSVYRNILIEMDDVPLSKQATIFASMLLTPTTIVFSGSKSLHAIWSFADPFDNEEEWRRYANALANMIEMTEEVKVDRACLNPSRFSRYPGYTRDNGKVQELEYLGSKADNYKRLFLLPWLPKKIERKPNLQLLEGGIKYSIGGPVFRLLRDGFDLNDGRKNLVFQAAKELKSNGVELDTAIEFLEDKCDIEYNTYLHQVKSAYKYGE